MISSSVTDRPARSGSQPICSTSSASMESGTHPYRWPSIPMKYGRLRSISARHSGSTAPSAFCSSVTPQRRSISANVAPRDSHSRRMIGKTRLTSSSRSSCISRNVEDTKTRIDRPASSSELCAMAQSVAWKIHFVSGPAVTYAIGGRRYFRV